MSPHATERSAWSSTKWAWLLLALCLIGWRVKNRVEQYHAATLTAVHQAEVSFFDANERNRTSLDATRSYSRLIARETDRLFPVVSPEPTVRPVYESQWEDRPALPPIYVNSVSLFSNPPPVPLS